MAITISGTDGIVGAGFTLDASGASVTAGVGTFSSISAGCSFTAAGLTGALPTISAANCTNLPAANLTGTLPAISGANLTGITAGITMADSWRVTSNVSVDQGYNYLTSNWERTDSGGFGQLGTGMTQSGGVFTFPSTGIYRISFGTYAHDTGSSSISGIHINTTEDNGSNYSFVTNAYFNIGNLSTYTYGCAFTEFIFDVTDTSTHKCRFVVYSGDSVVYEGSTSANSTYATFIRLGDT